MASFVLKRFLEACQEKVRSSLSAYAGTIEQTVILQHTVDPIGVKRIETPVADRQRKKLFFFQRLPEFFARG